MCPIIPYISLFTCSLVVWLYTKQKEYVSMSWNWVGLFNHKINSNQRIEKLDIWILAIVCFLEY